MNNSSPKTFLKNKLVLPTIQHPLILYQKVHEPIKVY
jgi:hypothetical protein